MAHKIETLFIANGPSRMGLQHALFPPDLMSVPVSFAVAEEEGGSVVRRLEVWINGLSHVVGTNYKWAFQGMTRGYDSEVNGIYDDVGRKGTIDIVTIIDE